MTNEERKERYMKRNIKLFPAFNAFMWDVLFVFTISTLFLTGKKDLSFSQVITLESFRMLFGCILCIPVSKLFEKLPAVFCMRIASLGYAGFLLIYIFGKSYPTFFVAEFCIAFAYAINSVKANSILTDSLHVVKRDKEYQRIFGSSISLYYITEAMGAIVITYVYNWNAYAPFYISLAVVVLITLYSFLLKEPRKFMQSNVQIESGEQSSAQSESESSEKLLKTKKNSKKSKTLSENKPDGYFKILFTPVILCMMIYLFFFRGVVAVDTAAFKTYLNLLTDKGVIPVIAVGYIFAGVRLCTCISSKFQFKLDLKFGVRTLIAFNVLLILTFVINGVMALVAPTSIATLVVISISSYIQCSLRMPNHIFCNNYIQVCLKPKNHERAYAIKTMIEYFAYFLTTTIFATLLTGTNDNYGLTNLIYIAIFAVPIIISLVFFLKVLIKKHTEKFTIIKDEYVND